MDHLLFAAYLILFSWLVTKVRFFTKSGLTPGQLVILFLLKVMAGIVYGWIGVYYGQQLQMVDTWYFHYSGLEQYELLRKSPIEFFTSLFDNQYEQGFSKFLTSRDSWWNDVKYIAFEKVLGLFDLFSLGNYYINVIFYSFITLLGPVAIYRVMKDVYPNRGSILFIATFLIPSFLFWTSGIHKDGLIFLSFALITYHFYFGFKEGRFSLKRIFYIILALTLLILRSFVILLLIPALLAWICAAKSRFNPKLVFGSIYLVFTILFFTAHYFHPKLNLLAAVADRQLEFLELHGNSAVAIQKLEPNFSSFVKNAPQAISLSMLRPYPTDVHHLFSLAASIEINLLLLVFVLFLFYRKKYTQSSALLLYCILFSISMLLMIGYTVNILGAIVRYRSIVLPFLMVPIMVMTDWSRIYYNLNKHIFKFNNY